MHPKSDGFLESSLYVQDVADSARFYARIIGFSIERQVLLLFKKVARSASLHHTMEMANCTSPSPFRLLNWRGGKHG
jgi:hypothetical protein